MKFQVPQFIEIEDKIIGPLTFKQFIYLAGGGGLSFLFFRIMPLLIAILLIAPTIILSLALAFYKVNNKPFIDIVEAFFKYTIAKKLYIWKKIPPKGVPSQAPSLHEQLNVPLLSESKLKNMQWSLSVKKDNLPTDTPDKESAEMI